MKALIRYSLLSLCVLLPLLLVSQAKKGVIDLRQNHWDQAYALDGEYAFYWNQLLQPDELYPPDDYLYFPSLWNDQIVGHDTLSAIGYATYHTQVLLDPDQTYMLHIEDVYSSFKVYFNGDVIAVNGEVASEKESYQPLWKPVFVVLPQVRDTNELVIQIANFDHSKGGALEGIEIGEHSYMEDRWLTLVAYDLILTGSLVMGGLFFLGLYFFGRHDKSILFFSLFCIVYSYRIVGFGLYVLHSLVDMSWYVATRLEYISLFLAVFLFGRFVHQLYPREAKKVLWDVISGLCLLFILFTLLAPAYYYTRLIEPFFVVLLVYILLTFSIYVKAKIRKRPGSGFAVVSTSVVFLVFAYNILVYFGLLDEWVAASFWGYILFFFSQSLILSYRFAYFLKIAKFDALKASQAKSDFLSTISHEIRTPLNAVVGLSHFLLKDKPGDHQLQNLNSLRYSAQHLTALINDILDYNKLESGTVTFEEQLTDLRDTLKGVYLSYKPKADEKGLKMVLDIDSRLSTPVYVDRTRLIQVLNNLMDNAIKFTLEGSVVLRVGVLQKEGTRLKIRYEIEDTGIGIPKDKHEVVFERFMQASTSTTREFGGTGLGLAIIKKLLELQGSAIHIESEPGVGTRFSFNQWYQIGEASQLQSQESTVLFGAERLIGRTVLLVEDNPTNVMIASKFLSHWDMIVDVAENGKVGVEMAKQKSYDIILMDLQMPILDGYQASREIRASNLSVPIVALTASALLRVKEQVMAAGMNDCVTKPFDPEELKRKLIKNIS
ncbi:response regulator [Marinoscillum furvescens]|uniref:histidine kinase n=1 Tax=Marinoscillum furvescens DSM 4134 TaxID=1122208 RepID=A0A3D9L573_MARFU|nr:response regulator [Marinoscillum furvescens]RED99779.1 signal transduction histidine kinase [Marinoscillum furvescens DSM 4134]